MIQVTAFKWVPSFARGSVRDIRVRWALEEAGLAYDDHLIAMEDQSTPAYRAWQPFGQVPAFRDGKVEMFESGAIVLYIAQNSDVLMPGDEAGRAMVMTWLFAAMNTIEPTRTISSASGSTRTWRPFISRSRPPGTTPSGASRRRGPACSSHPASSGRFPSPNCGP